MAGLPNQAHVSARGRAMTNGAADTLVASSVEAKENEWDFGRKLDAQITFLRLSSNAPPPFAQAFAR